MDNQQQFLFSLHTPIYNLLNEMSQRITEPNAGINEATLGQMRQEFLRIVSFLQIRQFNPNKAIPENLQFFGPEVEDIVAMIDNRDAQIQARINAMPAGDPAVVQFQNKVLNQKDNFEMSLDDIARSMYNLANTNNNLAGGKRKRHRKSRKAKRKSRKTRKH